MSNFVDATRIVLTTGHTYSGTAAAVLDGDPATYCDLFLDGIIHGDDTDYLRLDTGNHGQSIASVTLQNVAVSTTNNPVAVFVSDSTALDGGDNPAGGVALTGPGTNPEPGTADYVFTGPATGRYVWVRLTIPVGSEASSMTIGELAHYQPPAGVPFPTLTATPSLTGGIPGIILQGN